MILRVVQDCVPLSPQDICAFEPYKAECPCHNTCGVVHTKAVQGGCPVSDREALEEHINANRLFCSVPSKGGAMECVGCGPRVSDMKECAGAREGVIDDGSKIHAGASL